MYYSIKKRLISHPGSAMEYFRRFIAHRRKVCPLCGCLGQAHKHSVDKRKIIIYKCCHCKKTFSELYGTIFHRSKIPISKWLLCIIEWTHSTGSISGAELARSINVSYPTAWKMLMSIRIYISSHLDNNEILKGIVEGDEAWFGKKDNQDIVLGLVERGKKKLKLICIPNVREETLIPLVEENVQRGSKFHTDQRIGYAATMVRYHHQTTNHSKGEFARKGVHSNTIEQIWGDIKGIIRTIHHGVSRKYRKLYLAQYVFRYQFLHTTNFFYKTLSTFLNPCYCLY